MVGLIRITHAVSIIRMIGWTFSGGSVAAVCWGTIGMPGKAKV
jgi:hypothetical protein